MRTFTKTTQHIALIFLAVFCAQLSFAQQLADPERYEETILSFEEQDRLNPPPEGAIVLTGSSSIARWNDKAQTALSPLTVIPRGFGGSIMNDLLYYLDRVALTYKPRAILIYEGDNDTGRDFLPIPMVTEQLKLIITRAHQELPETRIYLMSVKPSIARWDYWSSAQQLSALYQQIANEDPLVFYIDTAKPFLNVDGSVMSDIFIEDDLHLNDLGNAIWGSIIKAALMPMEARLESTLATD